MVIGNTAKAGVRFFAFDQFRDVLKDSEGKTTGARSVLGMKSNEKCFYHPPRYNEKVRVYFFNQLFAMFVYSWIGCRNDRGIVRGHTLGDHQDKTDP